MMDFSELMNILNLKEGLGLQTLQDEIPATVGSGQLRRRKVLELLKAA